MTRDEPATPTYASGLIPHLPKAVLDECKRAAKPALAPSAARSPMVFQVHLTKVLPFYLITGPMSHNVIVEYAL